MSDTCGKNCRAYCSDRTCGAGDCRTCMGEGVCHDTCDRCLGYEVLTCPDCDGTGEA